MPKVNIFQYLLFKIIVKKLVGVTIRVEYIYYSIETVSLMDSEIGTYIKI